jgi:hypothetical protein
VPVVTKDGKPKADARKVVAYGPGLEPGQVLPGKPAAFTVDSSATGEAPVEVGITSDGKNVSRKPTIVKKGDGIHEVSYVPPPVGDPYEVSKTQHFLIFSFYFIINSKMLTHERLLKC